MTDIASQFITELFQGLDRNGIEHVVLRRVERLPQPPVSGDIDIVVRPDEIERSLSILEELRERHEAAYLAIDRTCGSAQVRLFLISEKLKATYLEFHFQTSVEHRGVELVSNSALLDGRIRHGEFWRPRPDAEAISILLHSMVVKGKFSQMDMDDIIDLRLRGSGDFSKMLSRVVGTEKTQQIEKDVSSGGFDELLTEGHIISASLLKRHPWQRTRWLVGSFLRNLTYVFKRRGAMAILVGPDGSGKTTMVDSALRHLDSCGFTAETVYFGVRNAVLPTKRVMRWLHHGRGDHQEETNTHVHANPTFKTDMVYLLGACHTLLDQWIRYWIFARPQLSRSRILICDRYLYDGLTTPAPRGLKGVFDWVVLNLAPRPDVVFVLTDDPQAVNARKPELSVEEIERQQQQYSKLFTPPVEAKRINVTPEVAANANFVANEVLLAFGKRNA